MNSKQNNILHFSPKSSCKKQGLFILLVVRNVLTIERLPEGEWKNEKEMGTA